MLVYVIGFCHIMIIVGNVYNNNNNNNANQFTKMVDAGLEKIKPARSAPFVTMASPRAK